MYAVLGLGWMVCQRPHTSTAHYDFQAASPLAQHDASKSSRAVKLCHSAIDHQVPTCSLCWTLDSVHILH